VSRGAPDVMRRLGSEYFRMIGFASLLYWRMYRMSFLSRSLVEVKMPRVITSRWMRANQFSTWFSQDEHVGV
jgi:hypothetical protein